MDDSLEVSLFSEDVSASKTRKPAVFTSIASAMMARESSRDSLYKPTKS